MWMFLERLEERSICVKKEFLAKRQRTLEWQIMETFWELIVSWERSSVPPPPPPAILLSRGTGVTFFYHLIRGVYYITENKPKYINMYYL